MATTETNRMLTAAASACEDKKAEDIRILALDPAESGLTDYFLLCNGTNERQNVAIADEIELRMKREFNTLPNSVEGRRQAEWILLDYVDFIVHVFSPEKRAFYGLERLRKSATTISVDDLNAEIKAAIAAHRPRKSGDAAPAKKSSAAKNSSAAKQTARKSPAKKPATPAAKKAAAKKPAAKKTSARTAAKSAARPHRKTK